MSMRLRTVTALITALFAALAVAQEAKPRAGDADKRGNAGSEAFGGAEASKNQIQKESERGAMSRSYSSGGADPWKMPSSPRGNSIVGGPRGGGGGGRF